MFFPTRTGKVKSSNSAVSKRSSYSPGATFSKKNSPLSSVDAVRSPGTSVIFTLSIFARVVRDMTVPLMPPPVWANPVTASSDISKNNNVLNFIKL